MSKPSAKSGKVDQDAKKAASDKQIFINACNNGNVRNAETILQQYPDPAHRRELANSLIKINVAYKGNRKVSLLFRAAQLGHVDIATLLLDNDAEINFIAPDTGSNPLFIAAQNGHTEVAEELLTYGADVDKARTTDGATPLFIAAGNGHADVVTALLRANANPDAATTERGATPLYVAAQSGHIDVVTALLRAKANPNLARTDNGVTPLFVAATGIHDNRLHDNRPEIVAALLAAGANPDPLVEDGGTLLKRIAILYKVTNPAILTSFTQTIDILLAYGARSQLRGQLQLQPLPDKLLQSLTNPAAIFNAQIMYPDKVAIIGTEEARRELDKLKALVTVADGLEIPKLKPYQPGGDYEKYAIHSAQHAFLKAQGEALEADQVALATYFNLMNYQEIIGADLTYEILNHHAIENFRSAFSSSAADLTYNAEGFMVDSAINDGNSELDFSIDVDDLFPDADHFNDATSIDDIDATLTTNEDYGSLTRRMASIRDVITILQKGLAHYKKGANERTGILDIPTEILAEIVHSYAKIAPRQETYIRQNQILANYVNSSLAADFAPESAEIISNTVRKALEDRLQLTQKTINRVMESIANKVYEEKKQKEKTQKIIQEGTTETVTTQTTRPEEESTMQPAMPAMKSIAGTVQAAVTTTSTAPSMSTYTGGGGAAAGVGARAVETSTTTSSATNEPAGAAAPYPTAATASTSTSSNATRSNGATGSTTTSPATTPTSAIAKRSRSTSSTARGL